MRIPLDNPPAPSTLFGVADSNAYFGRHAGIDYPVAAGTPVYACISGYVSTVKNDQYHGNVIDIKNGDKWYRVMHLSQILKNSGFVNEGELIGYSGNTGLSTGAHVHWDVRTQFNPTSFQAFVDPLTLLKEERKVMNAEQVSLLFQIMLLDPPSQEQLNKYVGKEWWEVAVAEDKAQVRQDKIARANDWQHAQDVAAQQLAELQAKLDVANAHSDQVTKDKLEQIKKIVEA